MNQGTIIPFGEQVPRARYRSAAGVGASNGDKHAAAMLTPAHTIADLVDQESERQ